MTPLVEVYNTVCALGDEKQFYIKLAKDLSVKSVIDLGCGTGVLTIELAKLGYQIIGVVPSILMLDIARKNSQGLEIDWIQGDSRSLRGFNADLAVMTGHDAQLHLEDDQWESALISIYNALKPGIYLSFESRNPGVQPWNNKYQANNTDWFGPNFYKKFYGPNKREIEYRSKLIEVESQRATTEGHYIFTRIGENLSTANTLIFRTRQGIQQSLNNAGFSIENVYGNWDWRIANNETLEIIFVVKKS